MVAFLYGKSKTIQNGVFFILTMYMIQIYEIEIQIIETFKYPGCIHMIYKSMICKEIAGFVSPDRK